MGGEPMDPNVTESALAQARRGVKLADMTADQRGAVKAWLNNEAGKAFWYAQADPANAPAHLSTAVAMRAQSETIA